MAKRKTVSYRQICESTTPEKMRENFDKLVDNMVRTHPDLDATEIRNQQLRNVGYIAGYYDHQIFENVMQWLGTSHPIFGRTYPSPEKAYEAGKNLASKG